MLAKNAKMATLLILLINVNTVIFLIVKFVKMNIHVKHDKEKGLF